MFFRLVRGNDYISRAFMRNGGDASSYPEVSLCDLSPAENLRAKEGGKEKTGETSLRLASFPFPWSLALRYQSLAFRARLCAKREAPDQEAGDKV